MNTRRPAVTIGPPRFGVPRTIASGFASRVSAVDPNGTFQRIVPGTIRWNVPLGSTAETRLAKPDAIVRGTPNLGGPIVTAGRLVFIAAAMDDYLRAFDLDTGAELWKAKLPAGGQATPMTYRLRSDGKQFVVIAAGGHGKIGTKLGDSVVAFALP